MMRRFGDRSRFAVEIGDHRPGRLRVVDLWTAGKRLTVDDDTAFVPSFCAAMRSTADDVRAQRVPPCPFPGRSPEEMYALLIRDETEFRERYWFMHWGETVDNVIAYAYTDTDLVIMFSFWRPGHPHPAERNRVFVTRLPPEEFLTVVDAATGLLDAEAAGRSG